jgi:hypothetical protein
MTMKNTNPLDGLKITQVVSVLHGEIRLFLAK